MEKALPTRSPSTLDANDKGRSILVLLTDSLQIKDPNDPNLGCLLLIFLLLTNWL